MMMMMMITIIIKIINLGNSLEVRKLNICIYNDRIYITMRTMRVMIISS
jgi:hypothetical protein